MRLPEEYDKHEKGMSAPVIYTIVAMSAFVLIILAVVYFSNSNRRQSASARAQSTPEVQAQESEDQQAQSDMSAPEDIEQLYREHKLRSEDLDFWNLYQDNPVVEQVEPTPSATPEPSHEPTEEEMAKDGLHTQVTDRNGVTKWLEISPDIPLYTYDLTKLKITNGKMEYYLDGEKISKLGVNLSRDSGEVNFKQLKASGVDFVMLRLGGRGYETGLVTLDEKFVAYMTEAVNEGLEIGVYFDSQAVNVEEAVEEARFVTSNLVPYKITYPVAFCMEYPVNDKARIDSLDEDDKTQVAEAFLSEIEKGGYKPMLYGNKTWLLTEIVPDRLLTDYDIWFSDYSAIPDYPYRFQMWRYVTGETVNGVEKPVSYTISFVDYARK